MLRVLEPGEPRGEFPVEGMALTGVGYVDGKLHLQTAVTDLEAYDNHSYFYLLDQEGNRIQIGKYLLFPPGLGR